VTRHSLLDRILGLYPRTWRDRYGDEVRDLADELSATGEFSTLRVAASLVVGAFVERVRSWQWSWRAPAVSGIALALVAAIVIVLNNPGPSHLSGTAVGLTKGTIPPSTDGTIDTKKVPDFISALGRDGEIVGYIPRAYLLPRLPNQPVNSELGAIAPVYAGNLKTLVGHMYPGVGFVALGSSPVSQPCTPITTFGKTAGGQVTTGSIACPSTVETVPNIVGSYTPTAMGQLSGDSLQASIRYVHTCSVTGGHVISVTPAPGSKLAARSPVEVVSSICHS
jgi:hypothetical protein